MVRISRVDAAAYTIPTEEPESDGTFRWKATTLVLATLTAGETSGIGFSYTAAGAARVIREMLAPLLTGGDPLDIPGLHARMMQEVRNVGRGGLARMAVSAADIALWDLKARLLGLPLAKLLGTARESVPVYGSGGFTSYTVARLQEQFAGWKRDGIRQMKMKVGRSPGDDPGRIAAAREAIGDDCALFIDANGAFGVQQALALARKVEGAHVTWFEEPVSSDDVAGLRLLRHRLEMDVAAGEYAWTPDDFRRLLEG
ncbi:MAG TPA: enolase C-terminal domain-like protein, partial [Bacteroidota bacterium]